jgi:hypothetical protein
MRQVATISAFLTVGDTRRMMLYRDITERSGMHTTHLRRVGGSVMLAVPRRDLTPLFPPFFHS